jgi:hypothetical protein
MDEKYSLPSSKQIMQQFNSKGLKATTYAGGQVARPGWNIIEQGIKLLRAPLAQRFGKG